MLTGKNTDIFVIITAVKNYLLSEARNLLKAIVRLAFQAWKIHRYRSE